MKRTLSFLVILFCCSTVFSQELQIPELFKLREAKAPVAVKNKLAAARREIASKNLQYVVGYT
ncbi:MAG: hypothetical protein ABFD02_16490, partial [Bacteroidales bacterium]